VCGGCGGVGVWGVGGVGVGGCGLCGGVGSLLTFDIPHTALVATLDTYDFIIKSIYGLMFLIVCLLGVGSCVSLSDITFNLL
jgi:hypothetical protein